MQARFYHPGFGRFTAPDPARDQHFDNTQSWNIYSYVRNNPIMSVDPTGMVEKEPPPPPGSNQPRSISESMDAGGSNPGFGAQTSGIIASGFSLSGLNGQAFATAGGVFVKGADLASSGFVSSNAEGNVSMYDMAKLPGAQFSGSTINMKPSESFASAGVAASFYNTASAYHKAFPDSAKLVINSANLNSGEQFGSHRSSHNSAKPSIDVQYQNARGQNLTGTSAAGSADVGRMRTLVGIANRNGFSTNISARPNDFGTLYYPGHEHHLHLGAY